jgi:hypothetical protein
MRIYLYSVKLDCEKFPCYSRILNKFIIERERERERELIWFELPCLSLFYRMEYNHARHYHYKMLLQKKQEI